MRILTLFWGKKLIQRSIQGRSHERPFQEICFRTYMHGGVRKTDRFFRLVNANPSQKKGVVALLNPGPSIL